MRRRCVKFSTKKSAYCQKCAFPTIRRIDTPKAAGIPKSADGIDTRFRNRTTIPSAHPNAYAPAGFFVFSCRKENAKNLRGGRQDSPRPCPLCAAHRKSPPDAPTQIGTPCVLFLSLNGRAKSQAARRTETVPHSTNEPTDPNESVSIFMSPASPYAGTHNRSQRSPHRKTDILLSFLCSFIIPLLSIFWKGSEPGAWSSEPGAHSPLEAGHRGRDIRRSDVRHQTLQVSPSRHFYNAAKGRYRSSPLYWERVAPEGSGDGTLNARIVAGGHLL